MIMRTLLQMELLKNGWPITTANNLSYVIVPPILVVIMFSIMRQHRHFLATRFSPTSLTVRSLGIAVLVGVLLRIAYWGQMISFSAFGIYRNNDPNAIIGPLFSFSCPPVESILLHLLVMSLLVPIIEEVINRGFLLYSFLQKGRLFAIVLSSVLFAVFHSPTSIPNAFVVGLFLAVFALNCGSLWAPIAAHATYNGLIVIDWMCLQGQWNPHETTTKLAGFGIFVLLVGVLCLFACSRLVSQKYAGTNDMPQRAR